MSTTALNYNADIRIDYKDIENNLKFVGSVNNIYTDNQSYNTFTTDTTLKKDNYTYKIIGDIDISGISNNYSVTKNDVPSNYIINAELDSLIITALRLNLPNNSLQSEQQTYSVAQDEHK